MAENYHEFYETDMPLSIIVPWRSGDANRELSFKNMMNCLSVQQTPASKEKITMEVIVVEQPRGNLITADVAHRDTLELIPSQIKNKEYPFNNFRYIQVIHGNSSFNKSWCMNVGARLAQYNHLVMMDADSIMGHDWVRTLKPFIKSLPYPKNQMVFLWNYLAKLNGKDEPIPRWVRPDVTRAMGGVWYANKQFYFDKFGGMNESYWGYGGEDNDAFERAVWALQQAGSPDSYPQMINYTLCHQYHDNMPQSSTVPLWLKSRANPRVVIERLKGQPIGDLNAPHPIQMEDLSQ